MDRNHQEKTLSPNGQAEHGAPDRASIHSTTATTPGAQRRVLVVEDDPTIVEAIAARLRAEGFLVQTAPTARPPSRRPPPGTPTCSSSTSCCRASTAWRSAAGSRPNARYPY